MAAVYKMRLAYLSQISAVTCTYHRLCHVPSMGSCSQFCSILHPHRIAVTFPPTFSSSWWNSFVQIHGETTLLKADFGTTPQKRFKNDQNWGVGSSYGTNKAPVPSPSFLYEIWLLSDIKWLMLMTCKSCHSGSYQQVFPYSSKWLIAATTRSLAPADMRLLSAATMRSLAAATIR